MLINEEDKWLPKNGMPIVLGFHYVCQMKSCRLPSSDRIAERVFKDMVDFVELLSQLLIGQLGLIIGLNLLVNG